eukprot:15479217-Alexandrium_andersonii.AAC.1
MQPRGCAAAHPLAVGTDAARPEGAASVTVPRAARVAHEVGEDDDVRTALHPLACPPGCNQTEGWSAPVRSRGGR